jgi:hypothetical protein
MQKWEKTKKLMWQVNPLAGLVAELGEKGVNLISSASDAGIEQLKEEVAKQNLQMQFAQQQARVAQELAIARRIDNAQEVMIEEFYDESRKGNIGLSIDQKSQSGTLGFGAEGNRVTKRVYHFKGWIQETEDLSEDHDE